MTNEYEMLSVSCITVVKNAVAAGRAADLLQCVGSVSKLKIPHEHLVYDGASTDGTMARLRVLRAENEDLKIISESDTGIYNALNKGVRDAKGEWLYVLGCDDSIIAPNVLDRIIADAPDDVDAIVTPVFSEQDGERTLRAIKDNLLFCSTPYCHQGVLVRTAAMHALGGFDERYRIAADYDLFLKLHLENRRIMFVDKAFACYAQGGVSDRCVSEMMSDFKDILREQLHLSARAVAFYERRWFLPFPYVAKYLLHRNPSIRKSACFVLRRWVTYCGICLYDATVTRMFRWVKRLGRLM